VLIALSCLGIVLSQRGTSTSFMLTAMLAGGFGLGLVLPNLTVFAQQAASREHLGIATALLQSLRMIGGMLGTAVTGTLVTHMYSSGVEKALESDHAVQWMAEFKDPEILVNHDIQSTLLSQMLSAGHNGSALLDAARDALVGAIHMGDCAGHHLGRWQGLWMVTQSAADQVRQQEGRTGDAGMMPAAIRAGLPFNSLSLLFLMSPVPVCGR